jgi:hypothetical protein
LHLKSSHFYEVYQLIDAIESILLASATALTSSKI